MDEWEQSIWKEALNWVVVIQRVQVYSLNHYERFHRRELSEREEEVWQMALDDFDGEEAIAERVYYDKHYAPLREAREGSALRSGGEVSEGGPMMGTDSEPLMEICWG